MGSWDCLLQMYRPPSVYSTLEVAPQMRGRTPRELSGPDLLNEILSLAEQLLITDAYEQARATPGRNTGGTQPSLERVYEATFRVRCSELHILELSSNPARASPDPKSLGTHT